ncbi:hypothetical protein K439DRAFT_1626409 [Ramaria rubella]|nr:hypothetical protein K439DRAFT_1626409 [Ramaria rubella]
MNTACIVPPFKADPRFPGYRRPDHPIWLTEVPLLPPRAPSGASGPLGALPDFQ